MPFGEDVGVLPSLPDTCSLDVADRGEASSAAMSHLLNVNEKYVPALEAEALASLRTRLGIKNEEILQKK